MCFSSILPLLCMFLLFSFVDTSLYLYHKGRLTDNPFHTCSTGFYSNINALSGKWTLNSFCMLMLLYWHWVLLFWFVCHLQVKLNLGSTTPDEQMTDDVHACPNCYLNLNLNSNPEGTLSIMIYSRLKIDCMMYCGSLRYLSL